jgi:branched-chain amino acid transport system substrate-binding protein
MIAAHRSDRMRCAAGRTKENAMRTAAAGLAAYCILLCLQPSAAQDSIKIGFSVPLTGAFAENGKQMLAAAKLFMEQKGTTVAGRRIELITRDDGGVPDQAKRIAQEFVVNDKVAVLMGYNPTPSALAVAPVATEAKIPEIVMGSSASITTERSPYIVRSFSSQPQITVPMAQWVARNGIKRVVTLVSDYAPGLETEKAFIDEFKAKGGEIVETLRVPLQTVDFAPFLQRARDAKPDALFVWVPGGLAGPLLRQYVERGFNRSGIKLLGTGDITDDAVLNQMGDPMLGIVTSLQYSAAHPSALNKAFVAGFQRVSGGQRPDHIAVSVYDGLQLFYAALQKTGGNPNGDGLIAAMKGMAWESPRGPVAIDPDTRDIVQNVYIRRVERVDGELYNVEFEQFDAVKDPTKAAKTK